MTGKETPALSVEHLSKSYSRGWRRSRITALRDLSLSVRRGEVFGLLGPNGAGKTTLVKILLGLVRPGDGNAHLLGRPVHEPAARNRIGYLPENHRFPGFLTASQMLLLFGRMHGVSPSTCRDRLPALLELVSMSQWADTPIRQFSKGMMQRIGIAQALINDPDVVFLDEPTDGVDPVGRRDIRDILIRLHREGKTIFLNSHLLSEVERVCTRVAIVNEGELVREGTVDELTRVARGYRLTLSPVPEALVSRLGLVPTDDPVTVDGLVTYAAAEMSRPSLNEAVDALRREGVLIDGIASTRRSLEDYFIEVLTRGNER